MFERLLTSFQNIFKIPELRTRVLFTLGMLIVYRVGAHIPTPGYLHFEAEIIVYNHKCQYFNHTILEIDIC